MLRLYSSTHLRGERRHSRWGGGFTLLEVLIVVVILAILAAVVMTQFMDFTEETESQAVAASFRIAGDAFNLYFIRNGAHAPATGRGRCPSGMEPYLKNITWSKEPNTGGQWDWDINAQGAKACICLVNVTWTSDQMIKVDEVLDDGNLSSGSFYYANGHYVFVVEK